jgi:hypothetical protein
MPKGYVTVPKDCEYCGEPIPLPRYNRTKYHRGDCAKKAHRLKNKEWKKRHPHYDRDWAKANPERAKKRRTYQRKYARDKARRRRIEIVKHYGGKCACCGEDRIEFLAVHHLEGGGYQHRKKLHADGSRFYQWLEVNGRPEGFGILCHNCNMSISFYGYCPHDRDKTYPEVSPRSIVKE